MAPGTSWRSRQSMQRRDTMSKAAGGEAGPLERRATTSGRQASIAMAPIDNRAEEIAMLRNNRWFNEVPPDKLVALWLRGHHTFVRRYAHIMREGVRGECFYVIIRGRVRMTTSAGACNGM